jgi:hypothetical protein
MTKQDIVRDALERFPELPLRTVARYIMYNYGETFDGDIEKIRSAIRYRTGKNGSLSRKGVGAGVVTRTSPSMPQTWRETRTNYKLKPGLWLVLGDIHIPFHEPRAIESAIKYGQAQGVTGILFNGDLQDCAAVSFWPSKRKRDFDKEVEVLIDFLDFIEHEFPVAQKVWLPGNHEYRLPRYYQQKAPELIGLPLLSIDSVLGLEFRGIEMLDYKQIVMAGKLPIVHGDQFPFISRSVNPARGLFMRTKSWALCSHCHTTSEHTEKNIHGKILTTWSTGCLCDLSPDYFPYGNNWNFGFAVVNVEKNGDFEVESKRILPTSGKVV